MKKSALFIVFAVLAFYAHAQDFMYGVKAGLNYSNISSENDIQFKGRLSLMAGGSLELNFSDNLSVQTELLYSEMGGDADDMKIKLNYIGLPVFAKAYVSELFAFDAGVQLSYLFSHKVIMDEEILIDGSYETLDYMLLVGTTVKTRHNFYFQLRYLYGLSEFDKLGKNRNNALQFCVGYEF